MINTIDHAHRPASEASDNWVARALCRVIHDPDMMFQRSGARQRKAAAFCRHCPVVLQCGAHALDHRVRYGVWGGLTEVERRRLLRLYPNRGSWVGIIAQAQPEAESLPVLDIPTPVHPAK